MKIITIGRGEDCNVRIEDPMVSRRHAVLRIHPGGKIEIIDYSANGTTVNGVRIGAEVLTRIKRGDAVTFAGVQKLDWKQIPNPARPIRIAIIAVIVVIALIAAAFGVKALINAFAPDQPANIEQTEPEPKDDSKDAENGAANEDKDKKQEVDEGKDAEIDPIAERAKLEQQRRNNAKKDNGSAKKQSKKKDNVQQDNKKDNPDGDKKDNSDDNSQPTPKNKVRG